MNGIPVMTAELKTPTTGQTRRNAVEQYRRDRNPKAPIFRFKERALVHFAVDTEEVHMTTQLAGDDTYFLPFNKGNNHGAGNPAVQGKHRTHYLWEEVWERHSFLDIVGRFLNLQSEQKRDAKGRRVTDETMIFPRYHQLDCVRKLVSSAKVKGAGENYLVQHSTGSGKSMSIAWLAHRLHSLHDDEDEKIYDSVVVITDRRVLDRQIRDTIYQIDHRDGVVEYIDHSSELAEALEQKTPIIITTLHKFPFVTDKINELPDKSYALVVDEAHRSQSGEMAAEMKRILSKESDFAEKLAEFESEIPSTDVDEIAYKAALARGPRPNLSFFAFTATPKYKTLEMFGHTDVNGKPAAFHTYSMKQAIQEGFILDVLRNYTTYKTYYRLLKKTEEQVEVEKSEAAKQLAKYVKLHPHNVSQKTEIMVEHFQANTRHKINGRAKAMVVTDSRAQAVLYKLAFDKYIGEQGYDLGTLVAFSDTVDHPHTGVPYTEEGMNNGIRQGELPRKFATDEFRILIVANKYQTGFDQPLLHTMYVDKRLHGIQAVQTLSRLNRQHPAKDDTMVLDFVNDREEILDSFDRFYTSTRTEDEVEPEKVYDVHYRLQDFRIIHQEDVNAVAAVVFAEKNKKAASQRVNSHLDPAVDRFRNREDEEKQDFKSILGTFLRLYSFMAQILPFADAELEKWYVYGRLLKDKLPKRSDEETTDVDITEYAGLEYYKNKRTWSGSIDAKGDETVSGPTEVGTGQPTQQELVELSNVIEVLNDRFGTDFTEADQLFFDQITEAMAESEDLQQAAKANSRENFKYPARKKLEEVLIDRHQDNAQIVNRILDDRKFGKVVVEMLLDRVYDEAREEAAG